MKTATQHNDNVLWHWPAYLQLQLSSGARGTRLRRCRHKGPLYVQKPFYPEGHDCAHIYLLHPPGGIVSGDSLNIDVAVEDTASTLVTTPGAARAYRARPHLSGMSPVQRQDVHLTLGEHATMEWFPMETIIYDGAATELNTHIELSQGSTFLGWEVTCFGLPARQELMREGYFSQHYKVTRDGVPLFVDHLHFDAANRNLFNHSAGMQGKTVSGFFIVSNDKLSTEKHDTLLANIRDKLAAENCENLVAITHIKGFYLARYLGNSANEARNIFTRLWDILRPAVLNKESCHPRIWFT